MSFPINYTSLYNLNGYFFRQFTSTLILDYLSKLSDLVGLMNHIQVLLSISLCLCFYLSVPVCLSLCLSLLVAQLLYESKCQRFLMTSLRKGKSNQNSYIKFSISQNLFLKYKKINRNVQKSYLTYELLWIFFVAIYYIGFFNVRPSVWHQRLWVNVFFSVPKYIWFFLCIFLLYMDIYSLIFCQ